MGLSNSKSVSKEIIERREYNERLNFALDRKLTRIREYNPYYHPGPWSRYMAFVERSFEEEFAEYVSPSNKTHSKR